MRKWSILILAGLMVLAVGVGATLAASRPAARKPVPKVHKVIQQKEPGDSQGENTQEPSYQASIKVPEPEPKDLAPLATITEGQAREAALKANPGTSVKATALENENGNLVWSVQLSNGMDVKVDAGNGQVLVTDKSDGDSEQGVEGQKEAENEPGKTESPETSNGR